MGVVYEAVQISLGRRVALKVLPFAAMLDPHRLQRFQNEARAAACLHHGNIVPVFAVGCDRGVHFYAVQYIEGRNLAALIQDARRQAGLADRKPTADLQSGQSKRSKRRRPRRIAARSARHPLPSRRPPPSRRTDPTAPRSPSGRPPAWRRRRPRRSTTPTRRASSTAT